MELCVIGLGYVGLPLATAIAEQNDDVVVHGLDIDKVKIENLEEEFHIKDIKDNTIDSIIKSSKFKPTTESSIIARVSAVIIRTNATWQHNEPDTSYITKTVDMIIPYLQKVH